MTSSFADALPLIVPHECPFVWASSIIKASTRTAWAMACALVRPTASSVTRKPEQAVSSDGSKAFLSRSGFPHVSQPILAPTLPQFRHGFMALAFHLRPRMDFVRSWDDARGSACPTSPQLRARGQPLGWRDPCGTLRSRRRLAAGSTTAFRRSPMGQRGGGMPLSPLWWLLMSWPGDFYGIVSACDVVDPRLDRCHGPSIAAGDPFGAPSLFVEPA